MIPFLTLGRLTFSVPTRDSFPRRGSDSEVSALQRGFIPRGGYFTAAAPSRWAHLLKGVAFYGTAGRQLQVEVGTGGKGFPLSMSEVAFFKFGKGVTVGPLQRFLS